MNRGVNCTRLRVGKFVLIGNGFATEQAHSVQ
jgi:hypothetical protein